MPLCLIALTFQHQAKYLPFNFNNLSRHMYFQKAAIGCAKRERLRGVIIDSAIEAFSKEGISGARVSNIAEQAGITGATFYKHFRDKDELTAATLPRLSWK
ncbi:MAG: helix-turn-helix domain-containing protein [Pseudomonadota bacterium]